MLHVTQPVSDGVAQLVLNLARSQLGHGWQVHVACPSPSTFADELVEGGIVQHRWTAQRNPIRGVSGESFILRQIVRSVQPDLVHLHSSKAGLIGRLVIRGHTATIFQPHAWSFLHGGRVTRAAAVLWERRAARWASTIVCGSDEEYEIACRRRIRGRMVRIPNAIDVGRFTGGADARSARSLLGLPDAPTVLCVGRLSHQKGQDVLLRAWPAVLSEVPTAVLVLVGDGPDRFRLQAQAPAQTIFMGSRRDCAAWFAAADVVVQPSRWETLSLSVLEAMASGRSVVATNLDCMAQALGAHEPTPLVPAENSAALSAAVLHRLLSPRLRAVEGIRNRDRVEQNFDIDTWAEEFLAVSRSVVH